MRVVVPLIHDIALHPPIIEVVGLTDLTGLISPQFQLRVRPSNKSVTFLLSDPPPLETVPRLDILMAC